MFERFTQNARRIVVRCQEEAREHRHNYVGTEHILLGLLADDGDVGCQALAALGISEAELRRLVDEIIGVGQQPPSGHIPFTPRAKRALELSLREALQLGHTYIGPEHILLGLIREGDGVAAQVLVKLGADLARTRQQVMHLQQPDQVPPPAAAGDREPFAAAGAATVDSASSMHFDRYTDRAKRVVVLAQQEARMLNHNYMGTEHLLLGLIHEGEGVAAKALEAMGIGLDAARQHVEEIIGLGQQTPSGHIPFTPRLKKVLQLSFREALQLGHNYVGPEHLLLGLVREGDGVAAQVLVRLGADLNRVRQQVIQLLHGYVGTQQAAAEPAAAEPARLSRARPGKALAEVVRLAAAEAVALGHRYVGTEHLLLGLLVAGDAGRDIRQLLDESVTAEAVRARIVDLVGQGAGEGREPGLTFEAADALDLAECEAVCAGESEVGPSHLLVAMAGADGGIARRVMLDLGLPDRAMELEGAARGAGRGGGG